MASESDFTPLITLPRWSFGLRQLFLWTAAVALGLVALRSASANWVAAIMALTLYVLAVSVLLVVFRRGPQRAYWIGFATFGWLYLLLLAASWQPVDPNAYVQPGFSQGIMPPFATLPKDQLDSLVTYLVESSKGGGQ